MREYSWDDAIYDYRLGALAVLAVPVHLASSREALEGRSAELLDTLGERLFRAAVESEAQAVLESS